MATSWTVEIFEVKDLQKELNKSEDRDPHFIVPLSDSHNKVLVVFANFK